ncbi:putative transferase [Helianthus annuus]|nr:putative transferase [Helianthus annuus]KAJ0807582.1 putative transferase [Helianthus annuus]
MSTEGDLTILEKCRISPPPHTVGERSLPLTSFDLPWLLFHAAVHQLFFYDFPHSKSHFFETIVPKLKHSLSITLQHFFPFAGNMIIFPSENHSGVTQKPEILHVDGDAVALTFAECSLDFHDLKGNHPRDCNKFHPLVPQLESAFKVSDIVKIPVFSIQVTIFPNSGITIGLSNHHSLCDARTRYNFLMGWTSIAKHGSDELFLASGSLPFYDRVINYPDSLDEMLLSLPPIRNIDENYKVQQLVPQPDKVRSTIVLTRSQITWLKKWLLVQLPTLKYVSSFVVGCGFVWSCIAKSRILIEGKKGSNGFPTAVDVLGTAIMQAVNNKEGFFEDMERSLEKGLKQAPTIGVAGTPKLNVYEVDFGWGRPKKYETVSLDFSDAISVNASEEASDDLEIGLCLPGKQMDAFITIYKNELESMLSDQF